jgi:hypothetical protein
MLNDLQAKLFTLSNLSIACNNARLGVATLFTAADIRSLFACVVPPHVDTAEYFCVLLCNIGNQAGASGYEAIQRSGAISIIFDLMRRLPTEPRVLEWTCIALGTLVLCDSIHMLSAIASMPDCESLPRACTSYSDARDILVKLGYNSTTEAKQV